MNGVTGRMGTNQHLVRSILAIREQGGVRIGTDETIVPEPIIITDRCAGTASPEMQAYPHAHASATTVATEW